MQSPGIYTQTLHYVLWDGGFTFRRPTVKHPSQGPWGFPPPLLWSRKEHNNFGKRKERSIHKPVTGSELRLKPKFSPQHREAEMDPSIFYAHPSCFSRGVYLKKELGYFHLLFMCSRPWIHHSLAAKNTYAGINLVTHPASF